MVYSARLRRVLFFGLIALAGCEGLIGADFDRVARAPDGGAATDGGVPAADATVLDGGARDAYVPPSACGDTAGLDVAGGYPMGRGCPTRAAHVDVLPPQSPRVKSRTALGTRGPYVYFTGSPVLRADGTALAVASIGLGEASGFRFALVGFKDGREVLRTELGDAIVGAGAVPAVAADGTIYVQLDKLYAVSSAGVVRWSQPLGSFGAGSPLVLGDGTIVVLSDRRMVGFDPTGAIRFSASIGSAATDPLFVGSVAASPTGTLYAATTTGASGSDGSLLAVSTNGVTLWSKSLSGSAAMGPTVHGDGRIYATSNTLAAFVSSGTLESSRALPRATEAVGCRSAAAISGFPAASGPYRFDIGAGLQYLRDDWQDILWSPSATAVVMLRQGSALTPPRAWCWMPAVSLWTVEIEAESGDMYPVAVDPAANLYAAGGSLLFDHRRLSHPISAECPWGRAGRWPPPPTSARRKGREPMAATTL